MGRTFRKGGREAEHQKYKSREQARKAKQDKQAKRDNKREREQAE